MLLSWSGGKDCALTLQALRAEGIEPDGLLTTVEEAAGEISYHRVSTVLLEQQAAAIGLPLITVELPDHCPNEVYMRRMEAALAIPELAEVCSVAFGDLLLADVKTWRESQFADLGLTAIFPLWGSDTRKLAQRFVDEGFSAIVCAVDTDRLDPAFAGRHFDQDFLDDLPPGIDPCGENGEFHTFVTAGPIMANSLKVSVKPRPVTDRFAYASLTPA